MCIHGSVYLSIIYVSYAQQQVEILFVPPPPSPPLFLPRRLNFGNPIMLRTLRVRRTVLRDVLLFIVDIGYGIWDIHTR